MCSHSHPIRTIRHRTSALLNGSNITVAIKMPRITNQIDEPNNPFFDIATCSVCFTSISRRTSSRSCWWCIEYYCIFVDWVLIVRRIASRVICESSWRSRWTWAQRCFVEHSSSYWPMSSRRHSLWPIRRTNRFGASWIAYSPWRIGRSRWRSWRIYCINIERIWRRWFKRSSRALRTIRCERYCTTCGI